jgi:tRNA-2-methylthio-N6-dimethylallyladenosine synthase
MNHEVLEVIAAFPCLARQIHLPLQSGDNEVLKGMNRRHTVEEYLKIIDDIHNILPGATLFTDIIVGFPGETEGQFEHSRLMMEKIQFNMAYIAVYSPRPGAASSKWKDDIPMEVKKQRLHQLTGELTKHSISFNRRLIGQQVTLLVTGPDRKGGYLSGYTEGRIVARFASTDRSLIGSFADMKITSASPYAVEGELILLPEFPVK